MVWRIPAREHQPTAALGVGAERWEEERMTAVMVRGFYATEAAELRVDLDGPIPSSPRVTSLGCLEGY